MRYITTLSDGALSEMTSYKNVIIEKKMFRRNEVQHFESKVSEIWKEKIQDH